MNIIITGATGFVGSNLVRKLHTNSNFNLYALIREKSDVSLIPDGIQIIQLSQIENLTYALQELNIDGVIHLASLFIAEHKYSDIENLMDSNLTFGVKLIDSAARANIKWFINTSSFWQHFDNIENNPTNLYAATKSAFESILCYYRSAHLMRITNLELFDTYGINDRRKKLISILLDAIENRSTISLSPGSQMLNLVHIDDVVSAYEIAIDRISDPTLALESKYSVHSDYRSSLQELAAIISKIWGSTIHAKWGDRPYRTREYMDPFHLHPTLPGWHAKISLIEGLHRLHVASHQTAS